MSKVAIVTGGATGLGRSIALQLCARGVRVVVADKNEAAGQALVAEVNAGGSEIRFAATDLTSDRGPCAMVEDTLAQEGRVDILVNNVGFGRGEPFLDMKWETWELTFSLNLRACVLATQTAAKDMFSRRSGRIINITSPASRMALPNYTAYAASKAAMDSFTRSAAIALAPHGIQVNSVAPGMMDTAMQRVTEAQFAVAEGRDDLEAFINERTARIPVGRRSSCDEIASGAVWLALDAPVYIVAERLNLSGGLDKD